jgi:ribosomal protein S27E
MKKIKVTQREIQEACKKQVHRDKSKFYRPAEQNYHFEQAECWYCNKVTTFSDHPDISFDGWVRCDNCGSC